jgi:hypothetical protein
VPLGDAGVAALGPAKQRVVLLRGAGVLCRVELALAGRVVDEVVVGVHVAVEDDGREHDRQGDDEAPRAAVLAVVDLAELARPVLHVVQCPETVLAGEGGERAAGGAEPAGLGLVLVAAPGE